MTTDLATALRDAEIAFIRERAAAGRSEPVDVLRMLAEVERLRAGD